MGENKAFVGGLSWGTQDDALFQAFSRFGAVTDAKVVMDRETGRSRGFGFVTFERSEELDAAIAQMDGSDLDGRNIRVNRSTPREGGGGGFGGGGGGGGGFRSNDNWRGGGGGGAPAPGGYGGGGYGGGGGYDAPRGGGGYNGGGGGFGGGGGNYGGGGGGFGGGRGGGGGGSQVCFDFQKGRCTRSNCRYAHEGGGAPMQ